MSQRLRLAWRQLTFVPSKLVAALAGVSVAVMLMWVQLGILASIYDSATTIHQHLAADLVVIHPLSDNMTKMRPFSSRLLYRFRGHPEVAELGELLVGVAEWRNPESGTIRGISVYGVDPAGAWLDLPGLETASLRLEDTFLFDRRSKDVFGPVVLTLERGKRLTVEVNHRQMTAVGLTEIATTFGSEGNLVMNRENFLRIQPAHSAGLVHVGLIRVRPGADPRGVQEDFRRMLGAEVSVLTPQEFVDFELRFWKSNAPVGFIFTMGTIVGFLIGFTVVYQILYAEVTNHLAQYATMKAIGFADRFLLWLIMKQAFLLSLIGYIPGSLLAIAFYKVVQRETGIPVTPTWSRAGGLMVATCVMCVLGGVMATRRLRAADPADVF